MKAKQSLHKKKKKSYFNTCRILRMSILTSLTKAYIPVINSVILDTRFVCYIIKPRKE